MPVPLTRRHALSLGMAAVAVGMSGCGAVAGLGGEAGPTWERATCVPRSALESHRTLGGLPLVYEPDQRRSALRFDAAFHRRLEDWASGLGEALPATPKEITSYGSWTDGGSACDSWHHAGRAFDLARIRLADGSEVSCRYDRWRSLRGARLEEARRRYWALAAGLHARFSYVLTYLYDAQHANHVHVDNGRSGDGDPVFRPRSGVQVHAVQAVCRYLWSQPVELTGGWDTATRRAAAAVLEELGMDGDLQAPGSWTALMEAAAVRGRS